MEHKLYISLAEAENLVFKKLIIIPKNRLEVERAQKDWSIAIFIENDRIINVDNNQIAIVAGAVKVYEIPEKEENLFLNHFRVPKGLVDLASRKYRDTTKEKKEINFPDDAAYKEEIKIYKNIRRALLYCYDLTLNNSISKEFSDETIVLINNFNKISDFNLKFIKTVIQNDFYPIKERNDGNFYPEPVKRFNWLGAYIFSELPEVENLAESDLKEAKQWLLNFKDKENETSIKKSIGNVPDIFFDDFEFIIGYYFASSYFEEASGESDFYKVLINNLKKVNLHHNNKVIFWGIFFQALFKDILDFLYVIPSLQGQQYNIEIKLLDLILSNIDLENIHVQKIKLDKKQTIGEYLMLKNGGQVTEPEFISKSDLKVILSNNLSADKIPYIGVEEDNSLFVSSIFKNTCNYYKFNFTLKLKKHPKEITFYLKENNKVDNWLKDLKIRAKPMSKIIDKNKKALVGFLHPETYERSLFKFYEQLININKQNNPFKTVVIVLLVNEKVEYIQSPEFQNKKIKMENFCKERFGENTTILVKNEAIKSDNEIKRNLKHILESYKLEEIELIEENIDDRKLEWILSTNNKYFMESLIDNPFTIINQ